MVMKRKMLAAVISVAVASLTIACVTASSLTSHSPLYTLRMEQQSSKMNFLPSEMNGFIYNTENGYILNYGVQGWCGGVTPNLVTLKTCEGTCIEPTCPDTCRLTCDDPTCANTCPATCPLTCDTCDQTCLSCETCITCQVSCMGITCGDM